EALGPAQVGYKQQRARRVGGQRDPEETVGQPVVPAAPGDPAEHRRAPTEPAGEEVPGDLGLPDRLLDHGPAVVGAHLRAQLRDRRLVGRRARRPAVLLRRAHRTLRRLWTNRSALGTAFSPLSAMAGVRPLPWPLRTRLTVRSPSTRAFLRRRRPSPRRRPPTARAGASWSRPGRAAVRTPPDRRAAGRRRRSRRPRRRGRARTAGPRSSRRPRASRPSAPRAPEARRAARTGSSRSGTPWRTPARGRPSAGRSRECTSRPG